MTKKGWLQQPLLSVVLLNTWLLLVDDYSSPGHWLFALVLALGLPRLLGHWWSPFPRIASWSALAVFVWRGFVDIIMGNLQVARLALGSQRHLEPIFVSFETTLDSELAIFMMLSAISLAPGSVTTRFDEDSSQVEVHALHCTDEEGLIEEIRERYERQLQKVFAC